MNSLYRLFLCIVCVMPLCVAEQRINFFVKTYPSFPSNVNVEKTVTNATNPKKAIDSILNANMTSHPFAGLFASYAGYVTISSPFNGQISFPRKQQNPLFYIVVTPQIEPIMMLGATVHHWQLVKGLPVEFYVVDRKQDQDTKTYFWSVRKDIIPDDGIVPLSSIVIFAKPQNIYLPLGITPTNDDAQLLLPTLYVKKGIDLVASALSLLTTKHFFRSLRAVTQKGTDKSWISTLEP